MIGMLLWNGKWVRMKVNLEVQYLCIDQKYIRGIPYYMLSLLKELKRLENNDYTVSFFDKGKERGNRGLLEGIIGNLMDASEIYECNTFDYRDYKKALLDDTFVFDKSYDNYVGVEADVYHFPTSICVPKNVKGTIVVTVHDMIPVLPNMKHELNPSIIEEFRISQKYLKEREVFCICPSIATKNDLQEYFDISDDRVLVIPHGFSSEHLWIDKNEDVLRDLGIVKPFLLYLGALDPRKGVGDIVEAYEEIKAKYDVQLVLAGTGESWAKEVLYPIIQKSKYCNDIILPGYVTEDQKRVLLSSTETFLFPSEYEGFGIPILEAMVCGAPVITGNTSSMPEVGGDAVIYVTPHHPEELALSIKKILEDGKLREALIQKGFRRSKEFTWKKTALKTEEAYRIAYEMDH